MAGIILGGDARYPYMEQSLRRRGVSLAADAPLASWAAVKWPPDGDLSRLPEGARLIGCGPAECPVAVYDLMRDEDYLARVARLTAEGAVVRMAGSGRAYLDADCLVIGMGRIGRCLSQILFALGARVVCASTSVEKRAEARARGMESADTARLPEALARAQVIFSTPAQRVIGEQEIPFIRPDARVMDLSSPPYGVDVDAAKRAGIAAWREPALPGRYCPETAGEEMARAVFRVIGRWSEWVR